MYVKRICFIVIAVILAGVLLLLLFQYDDKKMAADFYYPVDDAEYLGVSDLKFLPTDKPDYKREAQKIQSFSGMIIEYRYQRPDPFPEFLGKYISEETLEVFNPAYENNLPEGCYVYFDSQIYDIKHNFEKAIVSYGYNYGVCEYDSNNEVSGSHVDNIYPCKIYLEKYDGIWCVADIFEPA